MAAIILIVGGIQLLQGRGKSVGCADRLGVRFPLCPWYFFINAQGRMSYIAEQIGGERVCYATTPLFFTAKKRVFCSNVRFWAFSASICAMPLLHQTGEGDAGCAYLRKGEKRAVPAPFFPWWHTLPQMWRRVVVWCFEGDIRGNFTGKMWRNKSNKIQRIKRRLFWSKKQPIKSIIFLHKKSYKTGHAITIISIHIHTIIARIFIMLYHKTGHPTNDAICYPFRETPRGMFIGNVCR